MKQNIKVFFTIFSLSILLTGPVISQVQRTVIVRDSEGNPVSGASVTVGEEARPVITNEKGEFMLNSEINLPVLVEAEGFESIIVRSIGLESIELTKPIYQMGKKDDVNVPFGLLKHREITGAATILDPTDILLYDQQKSVRGLLSGRVPGLFGSNDIRGIGSPLFVINGVPRKSLEISLQEIEQITVLKDLSTIMMYGSQANNGLVLITTKRGAPLKRNISFTAESGINTPISYPNYLSAGDYMELYNEALANDGLDPRYSASDIAATRSGSNPVRYPDVDYYNNTYLRDFSTFNNIVGEVSGGNQTGQFYLNLGWSRNTGLLTAIKNGINEIENQFNIRSAVNYKVADWIDLVFDGAAIFNFTKGPRYTSAANTFWQLSSTYRPNIYQPLIPVNLLSSEMLANAKIIDDKYVLGGTSEYLTNIYGELTRNGSENNYDRLIEVNTGLNFDLSGITQGLSASGTFSFDMYDWFNEGLLNKYSIYRANFASDNTISSFSQLGTDVKVHERTIGDVTYYRRYGGYGTIDYRRAFGNHRINANGLVFLNAYDQELIRQSNKSLHYGLRVNYMYLNRYIAEITGVYTGSGKIYYTDNNFAFSPGIGLGWILSEETFLKDNNLVNFLKLRTNWAINHTDQNMTNYRISQDYYVTSGSITYNHGGRSNVGLLFYPGNTSIEMEKVMNFNIGFDAMLLNYKLGIEGSYFYNKNYDLVGLRTYTLPRYFGELTYENYGSYHHKGLEAGINYTMEFGNVRLKLGTNMAYSKSKRLIWDETNYDDEYRKSVGRPMDAIFGFVALGLFENQTEIDNSPFQSFGDVQPGDIKYKDLNNDGIIDDTDQMMIGNSKPDFQYGFHFQLTFKSFDLFALASGQRGADRYFNNAYYWVYGDRKYSEVVLNRWTPSTASTADYPRLSSTSNANNFRNSTFWLYQANWFGLSTVQLTYTLNNINLAGLENLSLFIRGYNLLTISNISDKLNLNIGSAPQMRNFSLGLKLNF